MAYRKRFTKRVSIPVLAMTMAVMLAACGQPPAQGGESSSEATKERAGETTGEARSTAPGTELQGIIDSYTLAHEEIEAEGGEKITGGYRVGYIVEPAEGWWEGDPGDLKWRDPLSGETNHIEILPFDAETGILVPDSEIILTVYDDGGEKVGSKPLELYYAEFYHYANNFSLPGGTYTLQAEISPPSFRRHGSKEGEGKVLTEPVTVKFEGVEIDPENE